MEVETAIRTRRTIKAFAPEPVAAGQVEELLRLAGWAPNHHLTVPWRFRVVGPKTLERLENAAGEEGAAKLNRAPTLVVASCRMTGDAETDEEDLHAVAVASYIVLLAAHGRGLAGYWRTPGFLRTTGGREAVGLPDSERFVGLLHLGRGMQSKAPPRRPDLDETIEFLE